MRKVCVDPTMITGNLFGRRLYTGKAYRRALCIDELREIARHTVPNFAFEYIEGGAEDERALHWNRTALDAIRLIPNTLVDTSARHQRISLFGREINSPLVIGPTGLNGMTRYRGDLALARAAAAVGIPFTLSTVSNMRLEAVAEGAGGRLWMQLYVLQDRAAARDILTRAERAGYEALVFTTDANVFGYREWDRRNYRAPGKLTLRNMLDVALHPRWVVDVLGHARAPVSPTSTNCFPRIFPGMTWPGCARRGRTSCCSRVSSM